MDHLPVPANPTVRLEIPYLCTDIYDGGPFATYPQRQGWELIEALDKLSFKRHGNPASDGEIAAFLQTWLYFGLLSETLGRLSPDIQGKFITKGLHGQQILTSRNLEELVVDWAERMTGVKPEIEPQSTMTRFDACSKIINRVVSFTHRFFRHQCLQSEVLDNYQLIALSALHRYFILVWVKIDILQGTKYCSSTLTSIAMNPEHSCVLLRKHMQDSNWCRSDICRIFNTIQQEALWYYANMQPPRGELDHSQCSDHFCSHTQIDSMCIYTLAHTRPDCSCQLIHADRKILQDILQKGDIPILELVISKSSLRVISNTQRPYIAISHIWAEGLGDPQDNALHSCEVERLFQLVEQLPGVEGLKPALWIDTLCVPLGDFKNLAIERMKQTYQEAAGVLVLDAYLQSFKAIGCDPLEILARINNSSWMQRLWTLQEGRLAKRIWFQFSDGPLDIFDIFNPLLKPMSPFQAALSTNTNITTSYRASRIYSIDQLEEGRKSLYTGIFAVREEVMCRAVSQPSDEALCLAFLMDLDVNLIVLAPKGKRMEAFWKQISRIPVSLVFSMAPEKLDTPGFHWAPRSFCGPIPDCIHSSWGGLAPHLQEVYATKVTEKGLFVELPGILFLPVNSPKGWSVTFKCRDTYTFCTPDNQWFHVNLGASWGHSTMKERPENFSQTFAIILSKPFDPTKPYDGESNGMAVVSELVDIHNDTFYINCLQHAILCPASPKISPIYVAAVRAAESLWETDDPTSERTDMLQYGGEHVDAFAIRWKAVAKNLEPQHDDESNHPIVLKCYKLAEAAMSDGELSNTYLQEGLWEEHPESERPKMFTYFLAVKIYEVFIEGYNKVEVIGPLQKWYVD